MREKVVVTYRSSSHTVRIPVAVPGTNIPCEHTYHQPCCRSALKTRIGKISLFETLNVKRTSWRCLTIRTTKDVICSPVNTPIPVCAMIKAHNPLVFLVSLDLVFLRDLSKQFFRKIYTCSHSKTGQSSHRLQGRTVQLTPAHT